MKRKYKSEDDLDANVKVIYNKKEYITGNRRHDLVDLHDIETKKYEITVEIKDVK